MDDRSSLSSSLADAVSLTLYTGIMVVVVLAVDFVALSLLDLRSEVGTWVTLLFFEAFVLLLFGVAGWGSAEFRHIPVGWKDARIIHLRLTPRHPWFWLSLGMAGVVLIVICMYMVSAFYAI